MGDEPFQQLFELGFLTSSYWRNPKNPPPKFSHELRFTPQNPSAPVESEGKRQCIQRRSNATALNTLSLHPDSERAGGVLRAKSEFVAEFWWFVFGDFAISELVVCCTGSVVMPHGSTFKRSRTFRALCAANFSSSCLLETDTLWRTRERKWPRN